jgi:hypothetical protein
MLIPDLNTNYLHEFLQDESSIVLDSFKTLTPAIPGPITWQGDELNPAEYVIKLNDRDILDIRAAVVSFRLKYPISPLDTADPNPHPSHWTSAR